MCLECGKSTDNPKFCSRSCSATHSNIKSPRRQVEGECKSCSEPVSSSRTYCPSCWSEQTTSGYDWSAVTKGDMKGSGNANYNGRWPYVRRLSRKAYISSEQSMSCKVCGYDYHVDICHIRDCQDFPDTAFISEINDLSNLVALCKNHHYEFDNGDLSF